MSAGLILALSAGAGRAATLTPLETSGYNTDVVLEAGVSQAANYGSDAQLFEAGSSAVYSLYEKSPGYNSGTGGLPVDGAVSVSVGADQIKFQLQSYGDADNTYSDNTLLLSQGQQGVLSIGAASQGAYSEIAILAASTNASPTSKGTFVLNFADGTHSTAINYNAFDWFFGSGESSIAGFGRVNVPHGTFDNDGNSNPNLYYTVVNLAALGYSQEVVQSIAFTAPTGGTDLRTGIFAVSAPVAVPEPSTWALLGFGAIALTIAIRRRRQAA